MMTARNFMRKNLKANEWNWSIESCIFDKQIFIKAGEYREVYNMPFKYSLLDEEVSTYSIDADHKTVFIRVDDDFEY